MFLPEKYQFYQNGIFFTTSAIPEEKINCKILCKFDVHKSLCFYKLSSSWSTILWARTMCN